MVTAIVLAGMFRAAQEIRLFKQIENILFEFFRDHGKTFLPWYDGQRSIFECFWGDKTPKILRYNPKLPITADFWHLTKDVEVYCWSYAVTGDWVWAFLIYAGFMAVFVMFYSYVFPVYVKGGLKDMIADLLNLFSWKRH